MSDIATPEVIFGVEPPEVVRKRPPSEINNVFAQLRENKDVWAIIRTGTNKDTLSSYSSNIKSGVHKGNVKGEFESRTGRLPDDMQDTYDADGNLVVKYGVWARYVGRDLPVSENGAAEEPLAEV